MRSKCNHSDFIFKMVLDFEFCPDPFHWGTSLGCVYYGQQLKTWHEARTECLNLHPDSDLFYPEEPNAAYIKIMNRKKIKNG